MSVGGVTMSQTAQLAPDSVTGGPDSSKRGRICRVGTMRQPGGRWEQQAFEAGRWLPIVGVNLGKLILPGHWPALLALGPD